MARLRVNIAHPTHHLQPYINEINHLDPAENKKLRMNFSKYFSEDNLSQFPNAENNFNLDICDDNSLYDTSPIYRLKGTISSVKLLFL